MPKTENNSLKTLQNGTLNQMINLSKSILSVNKFKGHLKYKINLTKYPESKIRYG